MHTCKQSVQYTLYLPSQEDITLWSQCRKVTRKEKQVGLGGQLLSGKQIPYVHTITALNSHQLEGCSVSVNVCCDFESSVLPSSLQWGRLVGTSWQSLWGDFLGWFDTPFFASSSSELELEPELELLIISGIGERILLSGSVLELEASGEGWRGLGSRDEEEDSLELLPDPLSLGCRSLSVLLLCLSVLLFLCLSLSLRSLSFFSRSFLFSFSFFLSLSLCLSADLSRARPDVDDSRSLEWLLAFSFFFFLGVLHTQGTLRKTHQSLSISLSSSSNVF